MDMQLLFEIFEICIIPLLGVLTTYIVKYINLKSEELSSQTEDTRVKTYISILSKTISDCVIATNQTYVDSLKKSGTFTKEAQEEAFKKTSEAVLLSLSEDAKECLATIYGDLDEYITNQIEATVNKNKTTVNK